jgi:hypothetical protein
MCDKILLGQSQQKISLGRLWYRWEIILKFRILSKQVARVRTGFIWIRIKGKVTPLQARCGPEAR